MHKKLQILRKKLIKSVKNGATCADGLKPSFFVWVNKLAVVAVVDTRSSGDKYRIVIVDTLGRRIVLQKPVFVGSF